MDVGPELLVFFSDFRELGGDCVYLSGDGHHAWDGGAENGGDGSCTGGDGLERARGQVFDQVWVQLEAVSGFGEDFSQEGKGGRRLTGGGGGGRFLTVWGAGAGNGSCQSLIPRGDGGDLHQGTGWGVACRRVSGKQSRVCVFVECRGVVEGEELDTNLMLFFFFFFLSCVHCF